MRSGELAEVIYIVKNIESAVGVSVDLQRTLRDQVFTLELELAALRADVTRLSERIVTISSILRKTLEASSAHSNF